jgi:large subunit ribosomal protein L13
MRTRSTTTAEAIANSKWHLIDMDGQTLGRVASRIAHILRGKHKATYTPHINDGDFVVVINVEKLQLTGNKMNDKMYYHHTGFPGGLKSANAAKMVQTRPEDMLRKAVKGMLPPGPLARAQMSKLKIYAGDKHPHLAQNPATLDVSSLL